jgi:hypothetical protein
VSRSAPASLLCLALLAACTDATTRRDGGPADGGERDALPDGGDALPIECGYPGSGYGLEVDDVLAPFALRTCEGEETNLPRLWCGQRVTVVHVSTAWCAVCEEATEALVSMVMEPLAGEPVALVEILAEGGHGEPASLEGCRWWSSLIDPPLPTYVPPDETLEGPLAELVASAAPPITLVIDRLGEIRVRDDVLAPEFIDIDMARLLEEIRALL